jgi:RHS repeat-associated protein
VTYAYDSDTIANGKGRLASVSSSVSSYSYSGYDALGRALGGSETIGTQIYSMSYSFDLAGHMKTMTYPSGHSITNGFDNAGRLSSFTGNLGDGTQRTYATGINYSPLGGTTIEQFGTQTSLYHKLQYNVRGQLWDVRVSTAPDVNGSWNRGCLQFFYDSAGGFGTSGPDNNGNVLKSWHYIPMDEQYSGWAIQRDSYSYDSLNRIASVTETYVSNTEAENPKFVQAYTYDRYGNRTINTGATWGVGINNTAFEIDPLGNNQLLAPGDASLAPFSRRVQYDQAGNLKTDTYTGQGTRTYDAENRMTEAQASAPASYSYDGDGHRIKRNVNGTETWQVYGLGGELIGEYAANAAPMSPQEEYGYRNGQLLITASATSGWGAAPTFNDNPLVVNQTIAKAQHITELRTAINAVRSHYNLSAYAWQYSATTNDYISANPILEMRTALDQALGAPSGGYSAGLAIGQSIKAIHIQELRDRILAAWQSGGGVDIRWLVTDQLGTPRMVFDQTGSLANVSRHDYLPFGEELFAGTGGRTTQQGYSASDGVRQHFTQKERDGETGLDYVLARYYSSTQGRFTSADPENAGADSEDPQSWNGYGYARSSPLVYSDPDGREYLVCDPDGGNCRTVSDNDFYAERKAFEKTGNVYTGNRDFFESGEIKNAEGGIVATYVQISIDDPVREFIFEMRRQTAPIPEATLKFFKLSVELGVPGGVVKYVRGPSAITSLGLEAGAAAETATIGGRTVTLVGRGLQNVRTVGSGRLAGATLEVIRHSQGETKRLERHFVN